MKYLGIKIVDAVPMDITTAKEKGYRVAINSSEGYEVTYPDGYKSWCPKDVFDKYNTEINGNNSALADTLVDTISPDYKRRFKAEYVQLKTRYDKLKAMLIKWDNDELAFTPTCPRNIYDKQIQGMELYLEVLKTRAEMEGVEVL